jgi:hypothetical protein
MREKYSGRREGDSFVHDKAAQLFAEFDTPPENCNLVTYKSHKLPMTIIVSETLSI